MSLPKSTRTSTSGLTVLASESAFLKSASVAPGKGVNMPLWAPLSSVMVNFRTEASVVWPHV